MLLFSSIGRFVKLELYFDNKWLLISEVNFSSQSTSKSIEDNLIIGITKSDSDKPKNEVKNEDQELLSDTPRQPESSKNGQANGKSNLKAKETNQVIGS